MNHLVIGIPTYKRIVLLEKLIRSIFECSLDKNSINKVDIIIVDNDIAKTAMGVVKTFGEQVPSPFKLHYFNNAVKGLSHVRNELLKQSHTFNPDYLICVDDDEYVVKEWLTELIETMANNKADIVVGPVFPKFENETPIQISKWFYRIKHENNEQLSSFFGGGNLILRSKFLKDNDLKYDVRFNTTGGEDTYFGVQALKKEARIFWAEKAIAYENIPEERARLNWLFKRYYRGGNTYTYILILEKRYFLILKKIAVSMVSLLLGFFFLPLILLPIKNRYYGLLKLLAPSLGSFSAFFNIRFHEYATSK